MLIYPLLQEPSVISGTQREVNKYPLNMDIFIIDLHKNYRLSISLLYVNAFSSQESRVFSCHSGSDYLC